MKKLLLLALIAAGLWWYFIGGRQLSEDKVRDFYARQEHALLSRDPQALCALLDDDFQSESVISTSAGVQRSRLNKTQTCEGFRDLFHGFETLGEKMGGILQLDSTYRINDLSIAADKKSATVEVSYSLDVAGSIMNLRSRSTETLIRKNGKVLMRKSESRGSVNSG